MSKNFNPIEVFLARLLSRFPTIKHRIKNIYSHLTYIIHKKKYKYKSDFKINSISKLNNETFFGYYDKHPDNGNGLVLVHCTNESTSKLPKYINNIELNVYSMKDNIFILENAISVQAFNWQQGCRAHWLDSEHFIYNDFNKLTQEYHANIYSIIQKKVIKIINKPVQDSYNNNFMFSICYKELARLRPDYGYFKHSIEYSNDNNNIGIWKCDLNTSKTELILSLDDIIKFQFDKERSNLKHKVNHIMISPNGEKFIFMHRYFNASGARFDRLILSNCNGSLIKILADYGMVSHCYWYDNNTILAYLRNKEGKDGYWLIDINSGQFLMFKPWFKHFRGDGHPSVSNEFLITDTYPDKARMQSLYFSHKKLDIDIKLGEFFHGFDFQGETRCDLHPRFSSCGKFVFFDSVFSGKRNLYYIDISNIKEIVNNE
ncbi:hypothetical protein QU516_11330 [Moellerella wisconsensis]|uniref:hypothetical protein n=1 Tax=Moellerella wisconsensis TaxID=158849 RepID=UPI0025AED397|nr:hypothetical protein [Moellerella wisconsensis]WJW81228.1 hypothetical protein QU516_11330 [Moellerella wisconsensis]